MKWTSTRVLAVVVLAVVVSLLVCQQVIPETECPEDYWPHQAQTPGLQDPPTPLPVTVVLRDMLDKAIAAYEGEPDPITKQLIGDCIVLIWRCAWQDLPAHWGAAKKELRDNHAMLVEKAAGFAKDGEWPRVKEYMTPNVPIPGETVEHPH